MSQFAKINSFTENDVQDMFELICTEILRKKPEDVRQEVSAMFGNQKTSKTVTVVELINTVMFYDIKFEFKLNWIAKKEPPIVEVEETGLVEKPEEKLMEVQVTETTPADSIDNVDEDDVPDFM